MKSHTEIIDKYLNNELSETEKKAFEDELKTNKELQQQFDVQKEIMKGIQQQGIRADVNAAVKKVKLNKLIKTTVIVTLTVALVVFGGYYAKKNFFSKPKNQVQYELNEKGEKNWSEADKYLESQFFKINPDKDTIIETKNGVIFQIKAGTFLNKFGETEKEQVDLEVKEAMTAADIIKAGLSTISNNQLLETGGMFYINARNGKDLLDIDQSKVIKVNAPSATGKNMSLFDGERLKDGSINWINPKPMKKRLTTVDILSLDFYPPNFIDSLSGLGFDVKNKTLTDSIYYSFANFSNCESEVRFFSADSVKMDEPARKDTLPNNVTRMFDGSGNSYTIAVGGVVASATNLNSVPKRIPAKNLNGEMLFKRNCATCHMAYTDQKLTGPGLAGIFDRAPKGDWLTRYILNNERLIKSGDAYANKIYNENGKAAMTVFEGHLNEDEVNAILKYLGKSSIKKSETAKSCIAEINPSRIRAIWDTKFNNTILATKEFEKRLKTIFTTCDVNVFNLYVENLNAELYEIDSTAASMLSGDLKEKFLEFYRQRDAGVDVTEEQDAYLQKYLKFKKDIYDKAVNDAMSKMYKDENKKMIQAEIKRTEHKDELAVKQSGLLEQEINANIDEAYRQLGRPRYNFNPGPMLSGDIRSFGWKNVDKYTGTFVVSVAPEPPALKENDVAASTTDRSTFNFKDEKNNKQVSIEYKEAVVSVNDSKNYDRIVCYLLPDKLTSFQLMKHEGNIFTEKLNMTFQYSIITVGYKGDKTYYDDIQYARPQGYTISLREIDPNILITRLNSRYNVSGATDMIKDIDVGLFEQKEVIRTAKINKREEIRNRLFSVVYPCQTQPQLVQMH